MCNRVCCCGWAMEMKMGADRRLLFRGVPAGVGWLLPLQMGCAAARSRMEKSPAAGRGGAASHRLRRRRIVGCEGTACCCPRRIRVVVAASAMGCCRRRDRAAGVGIVIAMAAAVDRASRRCCRIWIWDCWRRRWVCCRRSRLLPSIAPVVAVRQWR
ncbi:hypothetical protein ACLOJK_003367 [Asimina triloba]